MRLWVIVALFAWIKLQTPVRGWNFDTIVEPSDYPFGVLLNDGDWFCSGTIVHKFWVLTTAFCLSERLCELINIHPNVALTQSIRPTKCHYHHRFESTAFHYDIGLLKVEDSLIGIAGKSEAIGFQKISLPQHDGEVATVIGWGRVQDGVFPNFLLAGDVKMKEWSWCNYLWLSKNESCDSPAGCPIQNIPQRSICTLGMTKPTHTCLGDGGGPLLVDGLLAGITSFPLRDNETHCCMLEAPAVHVAVVDYLPWILSYTSPEIDTSWYIVQEERA